jgi:RNA polymerase sigma factor (sigma-70 family)
MIGASRALRSPTRAQHAVSGGDVPYLHVVDDNVYGDWEEVYRDNVNRIYRLMYAKVGNRADAEDLTSEVFQTALRPLRLSSSRPEVRAYLLLTAKTALASHWRRRLGHPVTTIDPDIDIAAMTENGDAEQPSEAPARADRILTALPERYRRILQLRFLEACSIKEAAHAMQISVSNAKVLQHRALRMAASLDVEPQV